MALAVVTCQCGSSESLVRNFLKKAGYGGWLDVPIEKGRERSLTALNYLPPTPEKEMLQNFLKNASKWAVIIGYDQDSVKWSDIAHSGAKSRIEAEALVSHYGYLTKIG